MGISDFFKMKRLKNDDENNNLIPKTDESISELTSNLLLDVRTDLTKRNTINLPISSLAGLGAGVTELIPALRTVTQTTTINGSGLYQLANKSTGDVLKIAKDGNFWGAFKTADGTSKFLKLREAGTVSGMSTTVMPIDPATMMMAAALFSIEQQLGNIAEMEKQILSFLENEKEAEIEADVETLTAIINKYKHNWDNEHFISSNHKLVLDIQRTARKHMDSYQKKVNEAIESKLLIVAKAKVNSTLDSFMKDFKYYRLSLYTFSLACLIEIMLSGNFREENIATIRSEIENLSAAYRDTFGKCSEYLEKMGHAALENHLLKGIGTASKAVGKAIGAIPLIKEGNVDEFLQDSGAKMKALAAKKEQSSVETFAAISNPFTNVFTEKMSDLIMIYNHTGDIYFDKEKIYLALDG